jgi:hypothetical protein
MRRANKKTRRMTIRILDAINSAPPLSVVVDVPGAGSSRMPNMTLGPRVNTALLLLVLVGGEGCGQAAGSPFRLV